MSAPAAPHTRICPCGNPAKRTRCEACRRQINAERSAAWRQNIRAGRDLKGTCRTCGKPAPRSRCQDCYRDASVLRDRQRWQTKGCAINAQRRAKHIPPVEGELAVVTHFTLNGSPGKFRTWEALIEEIRRVGTSKPVAFYGAVPVNREQIREALEEQV